jgi:excisionase family DNA binding protein
LTSRYGLELTGFVIENVSLPPEVEQAIDKRSSMAAVGNLNDYVKFQMGQGMEKGSGSGAAGFAAEMAMGMSMAQQMMQQSGMANALRAEPPSNPATASVVATSTPAAMPELLSPDDAARILGVSVADVMASLTSGDLKGKKIGSAWRISRKALEEFLNA